MSDITVNKSRYYKLLNSHAELEAEVEALHHTSDLYNDEINALKAKNARLRELVKESFEEGWYDGYGAAQASAAWERTWSKEAGWDESETKKALEASDD